MHFVIQREHLLKPLQMVAGAVEKRQTLPILSNVLLTVSESSLSLLATDLEIELQTYVEAANIKQAGLCTVPAKKLIDICRTLPEGTALDIKLEDHKVIIKAGRSRFNLSTLPAAEFPRIDEVASEYEFNLPEKSIRYLLECTHFAMAQQDVRYYLNGMLLQIGDGVVRTVATDAHRLSICTLDADTPDGLQQIIIPRKGVLELMRLLEDSDENATLSLSQNHLRVSANSFCFISKLIDSRYPDYQRVIPRGGDKIIEMDRDRLKNAFVRVSILSNEKYRGVRLQLQKNVLKIMANNPEQEMAEEELEIDYQGEELAIGFNVSYLLDVFNNIPSGDVRLILADPNSSLLIELLSDDKRSYVVMPMRL